MADAPIERVPGSFRDRASRVFLSGERVLRGLSPAGHESWRALRDQDFFRTAVSSGAVVATDEVDLGSRAPPGWVAFLEHERLPFVSHPYEWSFGMLRAAARLHLDLLLAALERGFVLKDASPYNVQWRGSDPVFVDVGSFERLSPGDSWLGYRQFCRLFLYPLMLTAYRDVHFGPWLRGSLEGIDPEAMAALVSWRDWLRPGVLKDVVLHASLSRRAGAPGKLAGEIASAGFDSHMIERNVRRLRGVVDGLRWRRSRSAWSDYAQTSSYTPGDLQAKADFVGRQAASGRWRLAWDLGANTGHFSRQVAEFADAVVAFDADPLAIELLYTDLHERGPRNVLPLVVDLLDPSPALGWRNRERGGLLERGRPDLVLALALVHHLVLAGNAPLNEVVDWLADLGGLLLVEWVDKEDEMARALLANKRDQYDDYSRKAFESALESRCRIVERRTLPRGTRTLYAARPR